MTYIRTQLIGEKRLLEDRCLDLVTARHVEDQLHTEREQRLQSDLARATLTVRPPALLCPAPPPPLVPRPYSRQLVQPLLFSQHSTLCVQIEELQSRMLNRETELVRNGRTRKYSTEHTVLFLHLLLFSRVTWSSALTCSTLMLAQMEQASRDRESYELVDRSRRNEVEVTVNQLRVEITELNSQLSSAVQRVRTLPDSHIV